MNNDNNKKRLFCKFENIIINLTTEVGQFIDPYGHTETCSIPKETFSLSNIHDVRVRTDTDGSPVLTFINNLIPVYCEFTTFNSYFNLTGPPQDDVLYFYDVSLYTPISDDHLFATWESYDKYKHRDDFSIILRKYEDIINNVNNNIHSHNYLKHEERTEYREFNSHVCEDRFLVVDDKRRGGGPNIKIYEDLKLIFADDKSFIRIIITNSGDIRKWNVYHLELSFDKYGTFIDAEDNQNLNFLETLRQPRDFILFIHNNYIDNNK